MNVNLINAIESLIGFMRLNTMRLMMLGICLLYVVSCSNSPIHDRNPVNTAYREGFPLKEFKAFGEKGDIQSQKAMIASYRKLLTTNILNLHPDIASEKNITFLIGSGYAQDVEAGDGKFYSGEFENELIIILNDPSIKDTLFLACGNGMLQPLQLKAQTHCGTGNAFSITIGQGESLASYFPKFRDWGRKASEYGILIRDENGKVVDEEMYFKNPHKKYYSVLSPGDKINLHTGKVTDANNREVNFRDRQLATFNTNIAKIDSTLSQINNQLKKAHSRERKQLQDRQKRLKKELNNIKKEKEKFL